MRGRLREEEEAEEGEEEEEESVGVAWLLTNLKIETEVTEEEETVGFESTLGMEVEEVSESEGEERGEGTRQALVALEFLTQEAEPSRTTLVDARNGFNKLSPLEMMWTMWHRWPAGARFTFN